MKYAVIALCALFLIPVGVAEGAQTQPPEARPTDSPGVRKLGPTTYEIGLLRVDTARREVTVPGSINDVMVLEFVANAKAGAKAYESALTLETDAIAFNTALLLIGLDPSRGRPPKAVFDTTPAGGDPVEMFVSWGTRRVPIEELLFDGRTGKTIPAGAWVYTGSTFIDTGNGQRRYAAELDGILIGLMHSPSAIIERAHAQLGYGGTVTNPNLGLEAGARVTLTIRALPRLAAR